MKKALILSLVLSTAVIFSYAKTSNYLIKALPTFLKVAIINDLAEPEEGVKIQLFETEEDYNKEINPVSTHYTNKRGRVTFSKLRPVKYYILARKDGMDNNDSAVQTDTLKEGLINKVTVIIR